MKHKNAFGALALIAVLLGGCGPQAGSLAAATAAASSTAPSQSPSQDQLADSGNGKNGQGQARGNFSPEARQMMSTFQSIIRMDKSNGLSITKEQAAQMLPIVQDSVTQGQLTADNKTKLEEKLTADQKKFLDDAAANMQQRRNGNDGGGNGGQAKGGGRNNGGNGGNGQQASPNGAGRQGQAGQGPNGGGNGGFQNIGQQLVDLLQSKTK